MNILPIILALILFFSKSGAKNLFDNFDLNAISPLLNLLGVDGKITELLSSDAFKKVINGKFDLPTLISLVTPFLSGFMNKNTGDFSIKPPVNNDNLNKLEPISDIAPNDVIEKLNDYFSA